MNIELSTLQANNTWDLIPLPHGKKPIGCKWVYTIKLKANVFFDCYKARLVANGYSEEYVVDYHETFSPVIRMITVRTIIALASHHRWPLYHLDVNNEFLHGDIYEEVYMTTPNGLIVAPHFVGKLKNSFMALNRLRADGSLAFTLS